MDNKNVNPKVHLFPFLSLDKVTSVFALDEEGNKYQLEMNDLRSFINETIDRNIEREKEDIIQEFKKIVKNEVKKVSVYSSSGLLNIFRNNIVEKKNKAVKGDIYMTEDRDGESLLRINNGKEWKSLKIK